MKAGFSAIKLLLQQIVHIKQSTTITSKYTYCVYKFIHIFKYIHIEV